MVRSTRELLQAKIDRLEASQAPTAPRVAAAIKRAAAIQDSLKGIREPIAKQAAAEQRNEAWQSAAINKAFGSKVAELARLKHEIAQLKREHAATRPTIAPIDKTDFLAAMEVIAVAQRVAATPPDKIHTLTPAEKLAALRVPALAKISPDMANVWHDEIVGAEQPERLAVYQESAEVLQEAADAFTMVNTVMQQEVGFVDKDSGRPTQQWHAFEREHLAPIQREMQAQEDTKKAATLGDAVVQARDALRNAEKAEHEAFVKAVKAM